jgi:uncharacterized protein (TIGR02757 family)
MKNPLRRRSLGALQELKPILDHINNQVESPEYVQHDPVQFMHAFEEKKDREIAGFLASILAWGRRDIVIDKTDDLLHRMGYDPYQYIIKYNPGRSADFRGFKHRTFKPIDIHGILSSLNVIYSRYDDFEHFWSACHRLAMSSGRDVVSVFHDSFLSISDEIASRTHKHISNPANNSPAKRLYMFLRWTIRKNSPVDTGIWNFIPASELLMPLDVHVARQSRRLGLLTRKSNDWKAVKELTDVFRLLDPDDPVRYDFALFGVGALGYELPKRFLLNAI